MEQRKCQQRVEDFWHEPSTKAGHREKRAEMMQRAVLLALGSALVGQNPGGVVESTVTSIGGVEGPDFTAAAFRCAKRTY
jgi:hypothetical protein